MKKFMQRAMISPFGINNNGSGGGEEWIGDGNTHVWISLNEGRTSPILGCCPNGTVTVDWGDGSTPDTLSGTSTTSVKWTPRHNYGKGGDYVITLTVDGEMGFYGNSTSDQGSAILRYTSSTDKRNNVYKLALRKLEIGDGVTSIGQYAFYQCYGLTRVVIPDSVTSIDSSAFSNCVGLTSAVVPNGITSISAGMFSSCSCLTSVVIPDSVTSINKNAFASCSTLTSVVIPDSVTSLGNAAFNGCRRFTSVVIPGGVTSIDANTFSSCYGMVLYDFTNHAAVPALVDTSAFYSIPSDCEIRVPAALVDEWKAATNWSTHASKIVGV